jgi:hypothetical protein
MKIALATYGSRAYSGTHRADDIHLKDALRRLGVTDVAIINWLRTVRWDRYDAVVPTSCWDSHDQWRRFVSFLSRSKVRFINPHDVLQWSWHKNKYLTDLSLQPLRHGRVPPSLFFRNRRHAGKRFLDPHGLGFDDMRKELLALSAQRSWHGATVVVKPVISNRGAGTYHIVRQRTAVDSPHVVQVQDADAHIANLVMNAGMIMQPYIPGVEKGEYLLAWIGGEFTHCIVRPSIFASNATRPRKAIAMDAVPASVTLFAREIMAYVLKRWPGTDTPAYARVDCVIDEYSPVLLGLNLVDPDFHICEIPDDPEKVRIYDGLARAIVAKVS